MEQAPLDRAQNRTPRSRGLFGVREAAEAGKKLRFNNLLHHVSVEPMLDSFYERKRQSAPGIDGVTACQLPGSKLPASKPFMAAGLLDPRNVLRPLIAALQSKTIVLNRLVLRVRLT